MQTIDSLENTELDFDFRVVQMDGVYAIFQVFYDEDGSILAMDEEPTAPIGESLDDLNHQLSHYLEAFDLPTLNFPEDFDLDPVGKENN